MVLFFVVLGMCTGLIAAVAEIVTGGSLLMALVYYSVVGSVTILAGAFVSVIVCGAVDTIRERVSGLKPSSLFKSAWDMDFL